MSSNKLLKYKWKLRLLVINTPDYKNKEYLKSKEIFQDNIEKFHKRYVKLLTNRNKNNKFSIDLIGFDGQIKHTYTKLDPNKIFSDIDKMPMGDLRKKIKPIQLSLFADYKPKTTKHGFGYGTRKKAEETIERLKNEPLNYQVIVVSTMMGRAKSHAHQTDGMREAIKVYEKWMKEYRSKKDKMKEDKMKKQNGGNNKEYPFLSKELIKKFEPLAEKYNISRKARGLDKPTTTNKGFQPVFFSVSSPKKLKDCPVRKNKPDGLNWWKARENRVKAKLGQMKSMNLPFFDENGIPTKMHTILIMWAYSPYPEKLKKIKLNL